MVKKKSDNSHRPRFDKRLKIITATVTFLVIVPLVYIGYLYAVSPAQIRSPKLEHYHFRMQVLVNGKAEDFSGKKYQIGYSKDNCNANLPDQPIHFHDNKDQFVHIHWQHMTGGLVMKYYGWNYVGGLDDSLGYRLDKITQPRKVPIHGKNLPAIPTDADFYVYSGDEKSYKQRNFEDWKSQDLEKFFGKESNFPGSNTSGLLDKLFPRAYAHGEINDGHPESDQERLSRINNLLGNVVIFVQKDQPSDQQVKDRFNQLVPLSDSTCGG